MKNEEIKTMLINKIKTTTNKDLKIKMTKTIIKIKGKEEKKNEKFH